MGLRAKTKKRACMGEKSDFHVSRHMMRLQWIVFIWRFIWKQVFLLIRLSYKKGFSPLFVTSDLHEPRFLAVNKGPKGQRCRCVKWSSWEKQKGRQTWHETSFKNTFQNQIHSKNHSGITRIAVLLKNVFITLYVNIPSSSHAAGVYVTLLGLELNRPICSISPVGQAFWTGIHKLCAPPWIRDCNPPSPSLAVIWDVVEVRVNCRSAMEMPCFIVCLSQWRMEGWVSETEGW